ncbi:MAG TPA: sialate O-acetylesterase [Roseimicrobium sp.]|nr:sialate O-acetylesterase [Roseimicrobium sp.]
MKRLLIVLMSLLSVATFPARSAEPVKLPAKNRVHLFLLVGQSNMAGRGVVEESDRTPHPRVVMLDKEGRWVPAVDPMHFDKPAAGVGLGKTFGRLVAEANPVVTIALIPCAVGGSPIDAWQPGYFYEPTKSRPWDDALRRAKLALSSGELKGILWHQGESDSNAQLAPGYEAKLHDLIRRLRKELDAPEVPFIAGQMGIFSEKPWDESKQLVDKAHRELPARVSRTAFVSAKDLKHKGDQIHFDSASCREFGTRYATAYFQLTGKAPAR